MWPAQIPRATTRRRVGTVLTNTTEIGTAILPLRSVTIPALADVSPSALAYVRACVRTAGDAGQVAWRIPAASAAGIVRSGPGAGRDVREWETDMDRLSEAGAGSKEPRTCRADVASLPRTAPPLLRGARAAALALAALAALALGVPGEAQAQTVTTFISNTGQPDGSVTTLSSNYFAQQFQTGSNVGGYTLSEIVVSLATASSAFTPAFAIHRTTTDSSSREVPGTEVVGLVGSVAATGLQGFTPDSATTLSASTKYFVVFKGTSSGTNPILQQASSGTVDPGFATGWEIPVGILNSTDSGITWSVRISSQSYKIQIKGTAVGATTNTAPTAANKTVTTVEDRPYAFEADDFGFDDADAGATLASVTIVTVPALGTLALDGTAVLADGVVTKAQIDDSDLTFTPARDAHGAPYTTFTFTVNDGTDDSASAYTMTIDVTDAPVPVCGVPDIAGAGRRQIWTGTVTVERIEFLGVVSYGFAEGHSAGTLLPSQSFFIGSNNYVIDAIAVAISGSMEFSLDGFVQLTDRENAALRLHVCDGDYDFNTADDTTNPIIWSTTLDWSPPVETRTVYLSLPANNAATGAPAITGTAQAGQDLTADASPIMDTDGVPSSFTYQWVRVDADGTSNEEDISGEIAATYTLTNDDVGKKIKVKVSFTDELSGEEERTSAAYPSSGTVTVAANTTAPALLSVTVTSTPRKTTDTYGAREHIEFSMTFDAPVTVTGDPTFAFDLGGPTTASWYAGSGTTTLRFSHAVTGGSMGDRDTNGIAWAENAIALNGGTIAGTDNAVAAVLTHVAQSNLADHKVDGRTTAVTAATVTDVVVTSTPMLMASGSSTADTYGFGETIVITVTVSEAVEVEGDPVFRFSLTNPGSAANNPQATYDRTRSIATTIVFTYTVQAGDRDTNGIWIGTHSQTFSLDANDRIRTASQQIDIDRSHPEYGTHAAHKVNGSLGAPTVPPDPTAPTLVSATATTLTIEWTHPGDGGSPLTRNFVHYRVEGATDWTNWYAGETPVTRAVITNLAAATAYDVRVHSSNAIGTSQWVQSATAFSTLAGTASCPVPTFTGRRKIWTGVLTMGDFAELFPANSFRGYDSNPESGDGGGLDHVTFALGLHNHEISRIALVTSDANNLNFVAGEGQGVWWDSTVDALRLHVCNTNFDFSDSHYSLDAEREEDHIESAHSWATDLDWSGVTTRTVHLSLPLNRPATGAPVITGPATVGQVLAVDVTGIEDEDGLHDVEYTYQWVRVDADGTSNEEDITDATDATYTLTDDDLGKKVKIEVSFPDDFGSDEQRTSAPTDTVTAASTNTAPMFSSSNVSREIAENPDAGQNVGAPVEATDADAGDTLGYTLGGADAASFDFVESSGQIRTKTNVSYSILDFEAKSSYTVTVTASDGTDTADATVTISVTDVDEPPSAPATPAVSAVSGSTTSLTVSWAAPANAGKPAIASYDVQYRAGTSGTWIDGPEDVTGTIATITSLATDTAYQARVRATNAEGDSGWFDPPGSGLTNPSTETVPGVTVSTTALTVTEEDTTGATYTVVLNTQPTANVTVTVAGHAGTDVTPSPTSLIFTSTTWGTAQTVTVTAGPDADTANDTVTLTHSAASTDTGYEGISIDGVAVTVRDNDGTTTRPPPPPPPPVTGLAQVMGVGVAPGNAHLVVTWTAVSTATGYTVQWMSDGEGYTTGDRQAPVTSGSTTRYTIPSLINGTEYTVRVIATRTGVTDGPPSEEMTGTPAAPTRDPFEVDIVGVPEGAVTGESYELTAQSDEASLVYAWRVAYGGSLEPDNEQMVIWTAPTTAGVAWIRVDATRDDGATAGQSAYVRVDVPAPALTTPGVTVSPTALTVPEEDTTGDRYTVVLDTAPTAAVTVTVAGHAGTDVTPTPATLTFTPTTWETAQTVTVTAGHDPDTADEAVSLTHSATSMDSDYEGLPIAGVAVTVTDNDTDGAPPGAPQDLRSEPGDAQVTLTWAAPASDGGSAILRYEYALDDSGTWIDAGGDLEETVLGLTNGQSYAVAVRAVNAAGVGPATEVTGTPVTTPGAPQDLRGEPGDAQVTLRWEAPTSDGGSAILRYEYAIDDSGTWIDAGGDLEETVPGLTNGQRYTVAVRAVNAAGAGPVATVTASPVTTPGAPQRLRSEPGDAQVTLRWEAPASDGGSAILRYEYAIDDSGTWIDAGGDLEATVRDLTSGQSYAVAVRAVNAAGAGPVATVTASPVTTPGAPQRLRSEPGDAQVTLRWEAPASDGGSAILRYEYAIDDSGTWIDAGGDLEATVRDLTSGQSYAVAVRAVNAAGAGPVATVTASPVTTPGAPQRLRSEPGDAQVTLRWEAPTSDGGSAILRYEYAVDDSGTWIDAGGDLEETVRDLTNGQSYAVAVRAVNAAGAGPATTVTSVPADPLPQAWLARFGRTATDHVVDAVSSRWHGGPQASHLTLGGAQAEALLGWTGLGGRAARNTAADRGDPVRTELASPRLLAPSGGAGTGVAGTGPGMTVAVTDRTTARGGLGGVDRDAGAPLRGRAAQRALLGAWGLPDPRALTDLRAALMGSSFVYAGAQDDDGQARTPGWLGEWSAWGRGAASWFSGADGGASLEGEVATAMLGFDSRWGRWVARRRRGLAQPRPGHLHAADGPRRGGRQHPDGAAPLRGL